MCQKLNGLAMIEQIIHRLIAVHARHKNKGTMMGHEKWKDLLDHFYEELDEFSEEIDNLHRRPPEVLKAHRLEELGDVYGCLVHAAIKAGFSMKQVEERELAKLKERFDCDAQVFETIPQYDLLDIPLPINPAGFDYPLSRAATQNADTSKGAYEG